MAAQEQRFNDDYFNEDLVYRVNKKGNIEFGVVIENAELYSSDESDEEEDFGRLKSGHIKVAWYPKGYEEIMHQKKVGLADRSLMPGDVVRRMIKGKDTQRGYCRYIHMKANVQILGTNYVIPNVKSSNLGSLEEFSRDIIVCLDSWVGVIRDVEIKLNLKSSDGSKCIVKDIRNFIKFQDVDERNNRDGEFQLWHSYFPGQTLYGPASELQKMFVEWTHISSDMKILLKSHKSVFLVVENIDVYAVHVHWQCRAYSKDGAATDSKQHPNPFVHGDALTRLKMINVFDPCSLQMSDRSYYTFLDTDVLLSKDQWKRKLKDSYPEHMNFKPKSSPKRLLKPQQQQSLTVDHDHLTVPNQQQTRKSDTDDWDTEDTGSFSDTASHSSSCSNSSQSGKKKKGPALMTKMLKKKKLRRAKKKLQVPTSFTIKPGDRVVVETLSTTSNADVVWQDGSVELNIPSTLLYPIHHLDDKEFFPGDFVAENKEDSNNMQIYGCVQSVDHAGRTAIVKWFRTYTHCDDPNPTFIQENEVSVYDLKDHPDFQYRPGTVVIRVANFLGEDSQCTAGQVLDNFPEGRVKVWWVDNHKSMCWPQDLYKVGEYDSDEGEIWDDNGSEESWETESEDCYIADVSFPEDNKDENIKPKLGANIEKARIAVSRLEEIFTQNPSLQTSSVMKQLLEVYKDCRYLDKLMGTQFFDEKHFQGLLERIRERGRSNVGHRVADHVSRFFNNTSSTTTTGTTTTTTEEETTTTGEDTEFYTSNRDSNSSPLLDSTTNEFTTHVTNVTAHVAANIESKVAAFKDLTNKMSTSTTTTTTTTEDQQQSNGETFNMCVKLCGLIKGQLLNALTEVTSRFGGHVTLNQAQAESTDDIIEGKAPIVTCEDILHESTSPTSSSSSSNNHNTIEINGHDDNSKIIIEQQQQQSETIKSGEGFIIETNAPDNHKYILSLFDHTEPKLYFQTVRKEHKLLQTSLPPGICVKGYEDRTDLYSVMIKGPEKTPYEDGLFFFDFQLSNSYPKLPPSCHYVSYCSDRLNPNLYEDGKVCVSLLGTWSGKGTEVWTSNSTLLQVIVSIQGLILVSEPYFNEAGYERQKGSQQGRENSRMYNEMVVLKQVQALSKLILSPPSIFKNEVMQHFKLHAFKLIKRLETWLEISEQYNTSHPLSPTTPTTFKDIHGEIISNVVKIQLPEFPLIPASKGFCLSLRKTLISFREILESVGITDSSSSTIASTITTTNINNS